MTPINIEWLSDSMDCDTCGASYAEGARVVGAVNFELKPFAHCYDGADYDRDDIYKRILAELGYQVLETNEL